MDSYFYYILLYIIRLYGILINRLEVAARKRAML